jgi:hypothetical protein
VGFEKKSLFEMGTTNAKQENCDFKGMKPVTVVPIFYKLDVAGQRLYYGVKSDNASSSSSDVKSNDQSPSLNSKKPGDETSNGQSSPPSVKKDNKSTSKVSTYDLFSITDLMPNQGLSVCEQVAEMYDNSSADALKRDLQTLIATNKKMAINNKAEPREYTLGSNALPTEQNDRIMTNLLADESKRVVVLGIHVSPQKFAAMNLDKKNVENSKYMQDWKDNRFFTLRREELSPISGSYVDFLFDGTAIPETSSKALETKYVVFGKLKPKIQEMLKTMLPSKKTVLRGVLGATVAAGTIASGAYIYRLREENKQLQEKLREVSDIVQDGRPAKEVVETLNAMLNLESAPSPAVF